MSGYVADVAYTLGFYRELAPTFLNMACVMSGVNVPLNRPLRYCELGCGRGYGTALLAAANPDVEFVGVDFNPSHIAEARKLATRAAISNVTFFEMGFADAARSSDPKLCNFDVIVLHGVYTWVEPRIRQDIHKFIHDKLTAGGLVYNSYNTLPGWASVVPIQHLLMEVANRSPRDSIAAVKEGCELLNTLSEKNAAFVAHNPGIKARIDAMKKLDAAYLAHEYLNTGWQPLFITDVMANFAEAKLTYIGSAALTENRLEFCVPKDLHALVGAAPDVGMRELLKDYIVNKQFRRDLYVKGPQLLSPREQRLEFEKLTFAATLQGKLPEKFRLPFGEVTPKKEALAALMQALAGKPASGAELLDTGRKSGMNDNDVVLLLLLLTNSGCITPARRDYALVNRSACERMNALVFSLAPAADSHRFVASPILGSAIAAGFIDRVIAPLVNGSDDDTEVASKAFDLLERQGQQFRRDGKLMEKSQASFAEIGTLVREFRDVRLPQWRSLGVVAS
jgi:SAM-dependent methyltransferase